MPTSPGIGLLMFFSGAGKQAYVQAALNFDGTSRISAPYCLPPPSAFFINFLILILDADIGVVLLNANKLYTLFRLQVHVVKLCWFPSANHVQATLFFIFYFLVPDWAFFTK